MKQASTLALISLVLSGTAWAGPSDYDGAWNAAMSCGPSIYNEGPFSYERRFTIANGSFSFTRERMLWNNRFNTTVLYADSFNGRVENGVMTVEGKGSADQVDIPPWRYNLSGPAVGARLFNLKGSLIQDGSGGARSGAQVRSCTLTLKLAEPAPASLAALETQKPAAVILDAGTVRQVQAALQAQAVLGGTVDGVWGPATEGAVREWQRRMGITTPFDAAQASTLIQSQQAPSSVASNADLSAKERQLAQKEQELADREKRLQVLKTNPQAEQEAARKRADAERTRQLADRQRQIDAKEQQITSQERAAGVASAHTQTQTASPFIGSWCSTGPGGSLTKMDVHAVEGQTMTGRYMYNGLPTQVDDAMSGTVVDGVLRARIGNVSWTLTAKGAALDGNVSNHRTGTTVYLQLKRC